MTWHLETTTIDAYVDGRVDEATGFSLEAHVLGCAACRTSLAERADAGRHERVWSAVVSGVNRPRPGPVERALVAIGLPGATARLVALTPSLREPWLAAVAVSLVLAATLPQLTASGPLPFLVLAPMAPLIGMAMVFGGRSDPAWEVAVSSPFGAYRSMLIRTASVLAVSVLIAVAIALVTPGREWGVAIWLLPALALTLATLALSSTAMSSMTASAIVGSAWVVGVVVIERVTTVPLAAFTVAGQLVFAAMALGACSIVVARRSALDWPGRI